MFYKCIKSFTIDESQESASHTLNIRANSIWELFRVIGKNEDKQIILDEYNHSQNCRLITINYKDLKYFEKL